MEAEQTAKDEQDHTDSNDEPKHSLSILQSSIAAKSAGN